MEIVQIQFVANFFRYKFNLSRRWRGFLLNLKNENEFHLIRRGSTKVQDNICKNEHCFERLNLMFFIMIGRGSRTFKDEAKWSSRPYYH